MRLTKSSPSVVASFPQGSGSQPNRARPQGQEARLRDGDGIALHANSPNLVITFSSAFEGGEGEGPPPSPPPTNLQEEAAAAAAAAAAASARAASLSPRKRKAPEPSPAAGPEASQREHEEGAMPVVEQNGELRLRLIPEGQTANALVAAERAAAAAASAEAPAGAPAAAAAAPNGRPMVLVLCGVQGSGKSTFCGALPQPPWGRVNQDTLGSREKCLRTMWALVRGDSGSDFTTISPRRRITSHGS